MRGGDLRKPRFDKHAREAAASAERLRKLDEGDDGAVVLNARVAQLLDEATRLHFNKYRPSLKRLIHLQDRLRIVFQALKEERGNEDEHWKDLGWETAGRQPVNQREQEELRLYQEGEGPKPFWLIEDIE